MQRAGFLTQVDRGWFPDFKTQPSVAGLGTLKKIRIASKAFCSYVATTQMTQRFIAVETKMMLRMACQFPILVELRSTSVVRDPADLRPPLHYLFRTVEGTQLG